MSLIFANFCTDIKI